MARPGARLLPLGGHRSDARWLLRAKKFADEAIEHAAFVRDGGKTLGSYEQAIAAAEQQLSGTALDMLGAM